MAPQLSISILKVMLLICCVTPRFGIADAWLGICFGEDGDNLPSKEAVVQKFVSLGIKNVRLYHTYPETLGAFANQGIELTVGLTNADYSTHLSTVDSAKIWVNGNIIPFLSSNIIAITVGNEVLTAGSQYEKERLLPSMQNLNEALQQDPSTSEIKVTHGHAFNVTMNTFPPSAGEFRDTTTMQALTDFLSSTGSFFIINIYPYFALQGARNDISLEYGRLETSQSGVYDSGNGLTYNNLLAQQLDSTYAALAKIGHSTLPVRIGEIGWPSGGGGADASAYNAQIHNQNLVNLANAGTPLYPDRQLNAYLFAMFNENQKPAGIEQNWGLYNPDFSEVYSLHY